MNVLVTGAAGFIGSHVAQALLDHGHHVVGLDDLSGGFMENLPDGVQFVRSSILDAEKLSWVFKTFKINAVYHLAAYAAECLSHFMRRFNYENNVVGSALLVNAAVRAGVCRFLFTSSLGVYGSQQTPMREDVIPTPEDPYGIAKYMVELDLQAAQRIFGLNWTVFRLHNVYGSRQNLQDRYRNVIGIFMNQLMRGEPMTIFGDGTQSRAFTDVRDVAPMLAGVLNNVQTVNQVFNVGADEVVTLNDLAELVAHAMQLPCRVQYVPARQEVAHTAADHSKQKRLLGEVTCRSLAEGLSSMAEWAKFCGPREPRRYDNIELDQNLPVAWQLE